MHTQCMSKLPGWLSVYDPTYIFVVFTHNKLHTDLISEQSESQYVKKKQPLAQKDNFKQILKHRKMHLIISVSMKGWCGLPGNLNMTRLQVVRLFQK